MVLLFEEPRREGDADINAVGDEFNDNCCNLESIISRLQQLDCHHLVRVELPPIRVSAPPLSAHSCTRRVS